MANKDRIQSGILGDISPTDTAKNDRTAFNPSASGGHEDIESMVGGSQHDRTEHSGSRDVTEGTTGGLGTETGGTRNFPVVLELLCDADLHAEKRRALREVGV